MGDLNKLIPNTLKFFWGKDWEDAPESPGIYAWFIPFKAHDQRTLAEWFTSLDANIETFSQLTRLTGRVGCIDISITTSSHGGEDWNSRLEGRDERNLSTQAIETLADLVLALSIFSTPIYVGKACGKGGIRGRLSDHINGRFRLTPDDPYLGTFASRVAHLLENKDSLRDCIVACLPISSVPDTTPELTRNFIGHLEHFLHRSLKPAQSKRG